MPFREYKLEKHLAKREQPLKLDKLTKKYFKRIVKPSKIVSESLHGVNKIKEKQ